MALKYMLSLAYIKNIMISCNQAAIFFGVGSHNYKPKSVEFFKF